MYSVGGFSDVEMRRALVSPGKIQNVFLNYTEYIRVALLFLSRTL